MSNQAKAIKKIVASLKSEPWKWHDEKWPRSKSFELSNDEMGVRIWVANYRYGLQINGPRFQIGGVTFLSSIISWAIPWRRYIWAAVLPLIRLDSPDKYALAEFVRR